MSFAARGKTGRFCNDQQEPGRRRPHGWRVCSGSYAADRGLRSPTGMAGPLGRWWNSPLLFLGSIFKVGRSWSATRGSQHGSRAVPEEDDCPRAVRRTSNSCLAGDYPNRTPEWCGWSAPPGEGKTDHRQLLFGPLQDRVGCGDLAVENLESLEARTRTFAQVLRETTLPAVVKEAASANLSTLATTTCFRTADGEFHGFEGSDNQRGCCFGNCTHVWNYETSTAFLFPTLLARCAERIRLLDGRCRRHPLPPDAS